MRSIWPRPALQMAMRCSVCLCILTSSLKREFDRFEDLRRRRKRAKIKGMEIEAASSLACNAEPDGRIFHQQEQVENDDWPAANLGVKRCCHWK